MSHWLEGGNVHARSIWFALVILCWSYGCIGQPQDGYDDGDEDGISGVSEGLRVSTPEDPDPPPPPPRYPPPPPPPPPTQPPVANPSPGPVTVLPGNADLQLDGT